MARQVFNPEGLVWKPIGVVGDLVMLSLLWGVCSIPLVTAGPATAALYDSCVHCVRRKENDLFGRFFHTFRAELKTGLLSTLLWAAVLAALFALRALLMQAAGTEGSGAFLGLFSLILLLIPVGAACWVFPLLSRFSFRFAELNRTAVQLALGNVLRSLAMALLLLLSAELCLRLVSPLIFIPGLLALLWSYLIEPVFQKYE
ncbi:MAG: YesL family protein [Oscillospiraceae bacterium]|nr:YesL family protein [Oscillospiraceae bacterium]